MKVRVRFAVVLCICVCVLSCNTGKVNVPNKAVMSEETALSTFDADLIEADAETADGFSQNEDASKEQGVLVPPNALGGENEPARLPFESYEVGRTDTEGTDGSAAEARTNGNDGATDARGTTANGVKDGTNTAAADATKKEETPTVKEIELQTPPLVVNNLKAAENPPIPVKASPAKENAPVIDVKKETPIAKEAQPAAQKQQKPAEPKKPDPKNEVTQKPPVNANTATAAAQNDALDASAIQEETAALPFEVTQNPVPTDTITPSRSATVSVNQYLDVVYPGAGWVYLGEVDESKTLLSFANRKLENADTNFVLRGKKAGVAILHFYKQDVLSGTYIDDYLEVIVTNDVYMGKDHRIAPSYADIVPPHQRKYSERAQNAATEASQSKEAVAALSKEQTASPKAETPVTDEKNTVQTAASSATAQKEPEKAPTVTASASATVNKTIQINESSPKKTESKTQSSATQTAATPKKEEASLPSSVSDYSIDQLLSEANKAYKNGKMNESLAYLNVFFKKATTRLDEGLYLKGQLYESAKADFRNIRTSLEAYQELVERYPSSSLWKEANKRITYINRFYFNIR